MAKRKKSRLTWTVKTRSGYSRSFASEAKAIAYAQFKKQRSTVSVCNKRKCEEMAWCGRGECTRKYKVKLGSAFKRRMKGERS